ncbi:MAG: HAD family hydrolase [Agathobacter sp.]|nr:HAD family hydrolase [Agathobacter sp.]
MIKAVIFDMFETLITHYESPLYFGTQMAVDAGIPLEQFQALWRSTEYDRSIGKVTVDEVLEMILRDNNRYSEASVRELVGKRIQAKEACFCHLHVEIIPMLQSLKNQGVKIGLISNCFSEEAKVIRESELFPYFDAVYLSNEQGICKPDKEIYHRCMEGLSVQPQECVYVGDGGSRELETAQELGMRAVQATWYLKEGTSQPVGRKLEFEEAKCPMDVVKMVEKLCQ